MTRIDNNLLAVPNRIGAAVALALVAAGPAQADQVIADDLIVTQSECIGTDCVNGESFGYDTLRLKENNLRIKFDDTSNSGSFPNWDWQLTANDSINGGQNKFSIDDITSGRTPFTIEGSAPSNSLYVDDGGRVGFGTATPSVELHVVDGDSPTLRLQQDGSAGFTPQTWDLVGNEASFFVRDVTNGSKLSFRIRPNAPESSIDIEGTTGDVGFGTSSPTAPIHVRRTNGTANLYVQEVNGTKSDRTMLTLENNGGSRIHFVNTGDADSDWVFSAVKAGFRVSRVNSGASEFELDNSGNLVITGTLTTGSTTVYPDYVFEPNYNLRPLSSLDKYIAENGHLPNIPSAREVSEAGGVNISELQLKLLEKIEELTLYTLDQEKRINELTRQLGSLATSAVSID